MEIWEKKMQALGNGARPHLTRFAPGALFASSPASLSSGVCADGEPASGAGGADLNTMIFIPEPSNTKHLARHFTRTQRGGRVGVEAT